MGVCTCSHVEARGQPSVVLRSHVFYFFESDYRWDLGFSVFRLDWLEQAPRILLALPLQHRDYKYRLLYPTFDMGTGDGVQGFLPVQPVTILLEARRCRKDAKSLYLSFI